MQSLTIGKVARLAGVGVETIRFYERQGLIAEPPRKESGYRQYPQQTVVRVRFIRRAKELGFTLKEINEMLYLRIDPNTTCEEIRVLAEAKKVDIEEKIRALQKIKEALVKLLATCEGRGPVSECPILDFLDQVES
ncbi:MAG: MerR family DNA-binding protein [Candidatus Dadabacteria bacterium]|nr:MerR family DNA-binding protein [Candidatus Dadabacteria bacterium]